MKERTITLYLNYLRDDRPDSDIEDRIFSIQIYGILPHSTKMLIFRSKQKQYDI